ncbi:hypothetical protein [Kordiimonas gwangyangensis]|uniref:hypothetical protein n=1 Tax=Kordiimonas gwangyangensis TaxID=288022 RepID=UPI00036CE365|nr:hypothetical protein [Kordiimonas gwangyangensis]
MRHEQCKKLFDFWCANREADTLPDLKAFFAGPDLQFREHGVVIVRESGDIFYDFCGEGVMQALGADILGKSMTFCYSEKFKALQLECVGICFDQRVGVDRYSRFWFGHRHKDVEWLLLPALDSIGDRTVLVGMSATFVEPDSMDALAKGSDLIERIFAQDYLADGGEVDFAPLSRTSWAMLDAMGAEITVDGVPVPRSKVAIGGEAAYAAKRTATASVLAVTASESFSTHAAKLGGLYKFRQVASFEDAQAILAKDKVDVLLTGERVQGGLGLDLIRDVQNRGDDTGCVLMLEPRAGAVDTAVQTERGLVYCLVKPLGDFALRKAIDDAVKFVEKRQKKRFYDQD